MLIFLSFCLNFNGSGDRFEDENLIQSPEFGFKAPIFTQSSIKKWKENILKTDQNFNGLVDQLEQKLDSLSKLTCSEMSDDDIPIIMHFPEGDITSITFLFKRLGGTIKAIYRYAINGFSGIISHEGLNQFCNVLLDNDIPFLVEEDSITKASLYYASRNMNLRPYVWNTLGYTGDNYSSIAVIDSGIDASHEFFSPGFADGNSNYKIIGWRDEVNSSPTPNDERGHGSHVAGIAAGNGGTPIDGSGRMVSTYGYEFNYPGRFIGGHTESFTAVGFNVTEPGTIEINCEFNDSTSGSGSVHIWVYLYHNETIVDSHVVSDAVWNHTLSYNATSTTLGDYSLRLSVVYDGFLVGSPRVKFRAEIHSPFDPPLMGCGNPWKGIAPDARLTAIKVFDSNGLAPVSVVIAGVDWAIANKLIYNITVISMSIESDPGQFGLISAVNNAVENGMVTVVAASNHGGIGNNIGSPGDADKVITVAAMSVVDRVTDYSSAGGPSYSGNTIKPDIMAPGGSYYNFSMFSAETNENDTHGEFAGDGFLNDTRPAHGTSMSTPAVAGAANLLIEAMGGHPNWNYTAIEAKRVKSLLLMTATETYPLTREIDSEYSPQLNRGGKDPHEGYGRLNIDAALEACTQELIPASNTSAWLSSSTSNPFDKHALGGYLDLTNGQNCYLSLEVPDGADFDLHLYSNQPTALGDPIMIDSSISAGLGIDETINYNATTSGRYYFVIKAISGEGFANITYKWNLLAPSLTAGLVAPPSGNQSTLLNFSVVYTDPDDLAPFSVTISINGTSYAMEKQNPSDLIYLDGCTYQYLTYLQPGTYNYSFACFDGIYANSTSIYTGMVINETNLFAPLLQNPQVSPQKGDNFTLFNFTVLYFDDDNNFPAYLNLTINTTQYTMMLTNPFDFNAMDGLQYSFITTLDYGYHQYRINCSDGLFSNSTNWMTGLEVNPFLQEIYITLFHEDFENDLSKWENITGLWHLTDSNSSWTDPYHSPNHSMWFGNESTGNYQTAFRELGDMISKPIDLSYVSRAYLQFYQWRECEENIDFSHVYISTDGVVWDLLYKSGAIVPPWEKLILNISKYCRNSSTRLRFHFDTGDQIANHFRGWLVDDVIIYGNSPINLLLPDDNSSLFTGWNNFTWKSLELPIGAVNYTLQISNMSNFSSILHEIENINEMPNNTSIPILINFPSGQYYWHIRPHFGPFYRNWSNLYLFNLTVNNYAPSLIAGSVSPATGNQFTQFNFTLIYVDQDDNPPLFINLLINGTPYPMTKQNSSDTSYTDGCLYQYLTYLSPGIYNYSFECNDGKFFNSTDTFGLNVTELNVNPPVLNNGQAKPNFGYKGLSLFIFTVNYTDADNNPPDYVNITINSTTYSMIQQDPQDTNYMDGCIFMFSTTLDVGTYVHDFNCSDGKYSVSAGPYNGPRVKPAIQWSEIRLDEVKIGTVIAHGEYNPRTMYPTIITELIQRGATITDITIPLNSSLLSNYDLLWFDEGGSSMTENETDAIEQWVQNGGGFFITGDDTGSAMGLLQRFNLSYAGTPGSGSTNITYSHPITSGVNEIYFPSPISALNISSQPNVTLCVELNDYAMVVAMEFGAGGFVIIVDKVVLHTYTSKDNHLLIKNTFGWLSHMKSDYAPNLTAATVFPSADYQFTKFNFTVLYTDLDNKPPIILNVLINNTPYPMEKQNPSDMNYTDGCIYQYVTYLQSGNYNYSFECHDRKFYTLTETYTGLNVTEVNVNSPILNNGQLYPDIGYNGSSMFLFTVNYTDEDNNAPAYVNITINSTISSMIQQDPQDTNYMDGCIFIFSTFLDVGTHIYYFNCSDGGNSSSAGPYTGPVVEFARQWNQVRLDGIRIGTVITHGEENPRTTYPPIIAELIQRGAIITDITTLLNSSLLSNYDIIWFDEYGSNMTESELDAIEQWVQNGGGFLVTGSVMGSAINLVQRFNISFVGLPPGGITDTIFPHPITSGVNEIYYTSPWTSLDISLQPHTILCVEWYGYAMVVAMQFGGGRFVIIVEASYTLADNHLLINNTFGWLSYIKNDHAPTLTAATVFPSYGFQFTEFNFTVLYTDLDNKPPVFINVKINDTSYTMEKRDQFDMNYTDGCLYQFKTYLQPGRYNYSFHCSDGRFYASSDKYIGLIVNKPSSFAPQLLNPQVTPEIGDNSTSFNFTVWYYDADDNFPIYLNLTISTTTFSMIPINPSDVNFTDGAQFYFPISLDFGLYQFQIECSDGLFINSTGWIDGPEVSPFYGLTETEWQNFTLLNPLYESICHPGWINFTWRSLELPVGIVNYTLQISNTADFSNVLLELNDIGETPSITSVKLLLKFSSGQYYWRVCPCYGPLHGNWSKYSTIIIIPMPGFFEAHGVWLLIIGASISALVFRVRIRQKERKKRAISQLSIEIVPTPTQEEKIIVPTFKERKKQLITKQLITRLRSRNREIRLRSANFLGDIGAKQAVPAIFQTLLYDEEKDVRSAAASALRMIGNGEILLILKQVMKEDTDPEVREHAAEAVNWIENQDKG